MRLGLYFCITIPRGTHDDSQYGRLKASFLLMLAAGDDKYKQDLEVHCCLLHKLPQRIYSMDSSWQKGDSEVTRYFMSIHKTKTFHVDVDQVFLVFQSSGIHRTK